ncbi:MAG: hypothetical protein HKN20_05825 [Gemmatimonadetes bacterium]|nr:hypothetical protein [Gemmatimonadota bacterium]
MNTTKTVVITRRQGQSILVGNNVEVMVEGITDDTITLRCYSPSGMAIAEREVVEQIANANRKSALSRVPTMEDLCTLLGGE